MQNTRPQLLSSARKLLNRMFGMPVDDAGKLYEGKSFLDGYIDHTNQRVAADPKKAIGGMWEEIGSLQFDFLRRMGLQPEHSMLDLGCGTLRGGRHFIRYLHESGYTGIDISPACIDAARQLLKDEGLEDKQPTLILNTSRSLEFLEFQGRQFDFILAQSVFTHLPEELIRECFAHVGKVMHANTAFYFTYWQADAFRQIGLKDFAYPWAFFEKLAHEYGFEQQELSSLYPHPREQKIGMIRKSR